MKLRAITFLAVKDLMKDKRILALVVFILSLSFVNVVFFASFVNGLGETFQNEVINTGSGDIVIEPPIEDDINYFEYERSKRKQINALPQVVGSAPRLIIPAAIEFEGRDVSTGIIGIDPREERTVTWIHEEVLEGSFLSQKDDNEILIGKDLAGYAQEGKKFIDKAGLDVDAGETVKVTFSNGYTEDFHVKAIVGRPFGEVPRTAYITYKKAEEVIGIEDEASRILVKLSDRKLADEYKIMIEELGLKNVDVRTWDEVISIAEVINDTYGIVVDILTFVGNLVAFTTIGVVTYISSQRKKRVLAVLRAIGTPKTTIIGIFLFQSLIFAVIGITAGALLTWGVTYYLNVNPVMSAVGAIRPILTKDMIISAIVTLFISIIIAAIFPAYRSVKEDMLKQMRSQ